MVNSLGTLAWPPAHACSPAKTANSLPSFSTPGFRQTKPPPLQPTTWETTTAVDSINVSDHSDPITPNPLKRTSSDPDAVQEPSPQAYKRPKKATTSSDKENLLPTEPRADPKDTPSFISRLVSKAATLSAPDPPKETNSSLPQWMEADSDLLDVSFMLLTE